MPRVHGFEAHPQHPDQEYFSDGLTEELLNRLAQIPSLKVPARSSCFHFKGKTDLQEVKRALGVGAVLEGSVRKFGSVLRVSAQLTDVNNGYSLWAQSYERQLTEIFAVQDDITNQIVTALELRLDAGSARPARAGRSLPSSGHCRLHSRPQPRRVALDDCLERQACIALPSLKL